MVKENFAKNNIDNIDSERDRFYNGLRWKLLNIPISELGIWDSAQGLPHAWCTGNLKETIILYNNNNHDGEYHKRVKHLLNQPTSKIIVVDGRTRRGRENCQKTKWNIDDGCMRALAFVLKGQTHILCYAGAVVFNPFFSVNWI